MSKPPLLFTSMVSNVYFNVIQKRRFVLSFSWRKKYLEEKIIKTNTIFYLFNFQYKHKEGSAVIYFMTWQIIKFENFFMHMLANIRGPEY
jgi:hypothetical protein